MTYKEKVALEHPEHIGDNYAGGVYMCPDIFGYEAHSDCTACNNDCAACWNREMPEETDSPSLTCYEAGKEIHEAFMQGIHDVGVTGEPGEPGVPHILDSGNRREFGTGAVRDIQEGKGRCDLMPLQVVSMHMRDLSLDYIYRFELDGNPGYLFDALTEFAKRYGVDKNGMAAMYLDVSHQFEDGAKKYGEHNWQKGIPVTCYIDSAVRHYLKLVAGWKDEPHDRAFVWNLMCCIWTCMHKPELNTYAGDDNNA